jgi:succinoglycan biosynthesis protein ExoM
MLRACLNSLALQRVGSDLIISIIVVDNEEQPNSRAGVEDFAASCPFPVHYIHEPKRGIASARNAALETALSLRADWIAMLDDDETAAPDWIAQLMHPDYLSVPVLMGSNRPVYPRPLPFWVCEKEEKGVEGAALKTAYTGNIRFAAALPLAGLRFDESLGLMGGEDNEMMSKAHAMGFEIRRTLRAVTYEEAHTERLTYLGQIHRAYWCSASELRRLAITRGWGGAALRKGHTVPLNLAFGVFWLLGAGLAAPVSREAFRDLALEGGKKIAKALGRLAALVGVTPQPYRHVVGQ